MKLKLMFLMLVLALGTGRSSRFISGSASCPTSGNAQVSTTGYNLFSLTVSAGSINTGSIYLGGTGVTTSSGIYLASSASSYSVTLPFAGLNPSALYFACTVSGDSVTWTGVQ